MSRTQRRFIGLLTVSAAVASCVLLVDRPLAIWFNERWYGTTAFAIGIAILRPLDLLLFTGAVLLVATITWRRAYGAPRWVNRFVVGGTAAAVALCGALVLKVAIGRSQVYPPFLEGHTYVCRPFEGSQEFMAFPSAAMAGINAFIVGIGIKGTLGRAIAVGIMLTLAGTLLVTGGHWLSDIIGGAYLGVVSGAVVTERFRRSGVVAA